MIEPVIIYEDAEVAVINKPAGLTVHPDDFSPPSDNGPRPTEQSFEQAFLTDWLIKKWPEIKGVGEKVERPGIVHRLDRDTSGVMVVAKTPTAFNYLKEQFQHHAVKKTYLALLKGEMKLAVGENGKIDWPIGRSGKDPRVRVASNKAYGKLRSAETLYKVKAKGGGFTLVEASPVTGRTHQLRAHFKALQAPIVCDELYGTGGLCPAGLRRQALHAWRLKLLLPSGVEQEFEAPLPADLAAALEHLKVSC